MHIRFIASVLATLAMLGFSGVVFAEPHHITGSGLVDHGNGVKFRVTISAHVDSDGTPSGLILEDLDLKQLGLGKTRILAEVTCVEVVGKSAWIGGIWTISSNEDIVPLMVNTIIYIKDIGGAETDIMHNEDFPDYVSCTSRPELNQTVVVKGNFNVR